MGLALAPLVWTLPPSENCTYLIQHAVPEAERRVAVSGGVRLRWTRLYPSVQLLQYVEHFLARL